MAEKHMKLVAALALIALLAAAASWVHSDRVAGESRAQLRTSALGLLEQLLAEDEAILKELQAERYSDKDAGILASYLARIRRDGVAKHADMKQRLDQLADNNAAIVALIKAYSPQARTPAFTSEADKFRVYASAWRDRWNSVMEIFMTGGTYAVAEVPFPRDFSGAIRAEISATT